MRSLCFSIVTITILLGGCTSDETPIVEQPSEEASNAIRGLLTRIDKTTYGGASFDYWPNGGLRNAYEHIRSLYSFYELQQYYPGTVFISGPHQKDLINLQSRTDFGHYDPNFVDWLAVQMAFICADEDFVDLTRGNFDKYLFNLCNHYEATYEALSAHPEEKDLLLSQYATLVESGNLPNNYHLYGSPMYGEELKFQFYADLMMKGFDPNIITTSTYFWFRRELDGTAGKFYKILNSSLDVYKPS